MNYLLSSPLIESEGDDPHVCKQEIFSSIILVLILGTNNYSRKCSKCALHEASVWPTAIDTYAAINVTRISGQSERERGFVRVCFSVFYDKQAMWPSFQLCRTWVLSAQLAANGRPPAQIIK